MIITRKQKEFKKIGISDFLMIFFKSFSRFYRFFVLRKIWTLPIGKRDFSAVPRLRGMPYLTLGEGDVEKCTSCMLCQDVCPSDCIRVIPGEKVKNEKRHGLWEERRPEKFDLDILKCCFCGFCEEACPEDAIRLSHLTDLSVETREQGVYQKEFLKRKVVNHG